MTRATRAACGGRLAHSASEYADIRPFSGDSALTLTPPPPVAGLKGGMTLHTTLFRSCADARLQLAGNAADSACLCADVVFCTTKSEKTASLLKESCKMYTILNEIHRFYADEAINFVRNTIFGPAFSNIARNCVLNATLPSSHSRLTFSSRIRPQVKQHNRKGEREPW